MLIDVPLDVNGASDEIYQIQNKDSMEVMR